MIDTTTKEWFCRGRRLEAHIRSLQATKDRIRAGLTSTTARYDGDQVSGTRDPHKYDGLVQMEDIIDREIVRLYEIKREILSVILQIQDTRYRDVLTKRYIDSRTWEEIAVEMQYSLDHVRGALHGAALRAAEPLIPKDNTQ